MRSHYKKLIIAAALLVAPVAFAEDGNRPPHPQLFPAFSSDREHRDGSTTTPRMPMMPRPGHMEGSTTLELRGMDVPLPPRMASSTRPGDGFGWGWGFDHGDGRPATTSSTTTPRERPLPPRDHMMGSSTQHEIDMENGTSTPTEHPRGGIFARLFNFFSGKHDNSSTTPPQQTRAGETSEASSTEVTSTGQPQPPRPVIEFLQNFFGRFFH